ncbi:MAG: YjbF family lipoprotein [Pseudomonadota bacterium]
MTRTGFHLPICLFVAVGILAGCTNSRQDANALTLARTFWESFQSSRRDPVPPDPALVNATVKSALASTDEPLALLSFDVNKSVALLRQIETNGPYRTWATYGSSERRSITTRGGVVTATRGLGFDLMSSSVGGLLEMVTQLEDGIAQQVLRYLDGENVVTEIEAYCAFTPGETETYSRGALRQQATRVDVFCKTETGRFSNYYLVGASGRILEARQWLGPELGFGLMQQLR